MGELGNGIRNGKKGGCHTKRACEKISVNYIISRSSMIKYKS